VEILTSKIVMTFSKLSHLAASLCLAFVAWVGLAGRSAMAAPVRVVSQTVGSDELLLAVADPSQIAALSHLAGDPSYSAIVDEAKPYPRVVLGADAEGILKYSPTLVLFANYSRSELVEQVRRAHVQVIVFDHYATLADVYANLRLLAHAIGTDARAEKLIADCEKRVATLQLKLRGVKPVRVIAPSIYAMIPGDNTTFQDLCDHAGAENLAATLGHLHGHAPPPSEQMLTWPVDRIVVAGKNLESALAPFKSLPPYALMPVVRENRAVLIEPYQISCVSQHRIDGYERLARDLHPEIFK
jgi:iron complex transport system substrate-binding protein